MIRDARIKPDAFAHASSLHATSPPDEQLPLRRYKAVSKFVPAPQVWMVATPETAGVHLNTLSGEVPVLPHVPASVLEPLVTPLKVPPWDGMIVGLLQAPPAGSVVVVVVAVQVGVALLAWTLSADVLPAPSTAATAL